MVCVLCLNIQDFPQGLYDSLYALASPSRRQRADRCRNSQDALRCITGEALLRKVLRDRLQNQNPHIVQEPGGKPRVEQLPGFHFNLSHAASWVVLAWGDSPVGIDVEAVARGKERLARRFFSPEEQAYIFSSAQEVPERFTQIWTAKESYLKYLGTGLSTPLTSFCTRTMSSPRFFSRILEDGAVLTLCTREDTWEMAFLNPEQLL